MCSLNCFSRGASKSFLRNIKLSLRLTCGQSYKYFTLINYDSRVIPDVKTLHITTLGS